MLLVNLGRFAMLAWAIYALLLIFVPALLHQPKNPKSGMVQFVLAYGLGWALDRVLGILRRRQARAGVAADPAGETGPL